MYDHHVLNELGRDRHQRFLDDALQRPVRRRKWLILLLLAQLARLLPALHR